MSSSSGEPLPPGDEPASNGRLDSWKEIASYLRRSVRSAKRWEKEEGLPVHRHVHAKRDSVYAYRAELDGWWTNRGAKLTDQNGAEDAASQPETGTLEGSSSLAEAEREEEIGPPPSPALRRSALIGIGFGLAVVLVGVVAWLSRNGSSPSAGSLRPLPFKARDWVLVTSFENRTDEPLFDGTLEYALERELGSSRYVNVVPRERIGDVLRLMRKPPETRLDAKLGLEVCLRDGGIRALLTGRIDRSLSGYRLTADLVSPNQDTSLISLSEEAENKESVIKATRRLSDRLRQALGEGPSVNRPEQRLSSVTTLSLRALQLYSEADALLKAPSGLSPASARLDFASAEELLRQAVAEDPQFASAHIHLAWAVRNQGRPEQDWKESAETALRLSETTTERERYFIRGSYYQLQRQDEKAIAAYQALLSIYPDHFWGTGNLAGLYTSVGRSTEAVALEVRRADMRPNDLFANSQAAVGLSVWASDPVRAEVYVNRALGLVSAETAKEMPGVVGFVEIFAACKSWSEGDMPKALQEVDRAAAKIASFTGLARESLADNVAMSYLALGRLAAAERSYEAISDPILRHERLSRVAFARDDMRALRTHLQAIGAVNFRRFASVVLLTRAGLLPQARQAAAEMGANSPPGTLELAQGEIAFAGGHIDLAITRLQESTNRHSLANNQWGLLLGSETLAAALRKKGEMAQAIRTLERATEKKTSTAFERAGAFWLRARFALTQLYRQTGREQDARKIESELSAFLAFADPDHPIRRELDRLKGS
jgi:tetratricopeptide (TPR) repeat protein